MKTNRLLTLFLARCVYFIELKLFDKNGSSVSKNICWKTSDKNEDMSLLSHLPPVKLDITAQGVKKGNEMEYHIKVINNTKNPSFFNRLIITRGYGGEEILPVFWQDNFLILFPGDVKSFRAYLSLDDIGNSEPVLCIDGNPLVDGLVLNKETYASY